MGQAICIRKDEKPLGYDWECGHEELYVRVNMYYNGSLYVGLWQKQKECEEKLELFGDLTIGVMGFLRPGQAIISDCGAKAKVAFIEKYKLGKVVGKRKINYDILYEGDTLHHCVNKTDTYFDRIVSKESYILFLREKENPKVPFYTLEVEPDGTIRQKRAEFNRQNKDIDKVTSFLTLWQKEIQKRLTQKDRKSTEESRKLRQQNYQEIRDKHVVVHGGTFAGKLLADLLEKDLMDLPVESAESEESPTEIAA